MKKPFFGLLALCFTLPVLNTSVHALWNRFCHTHLKECKKFFLEWENKRIEFLEKEKECIRNAKSYSELMYCSHKFDNEKFKAYGEWKRSVNKRIREIEKNFK
jgi:hypothetical protein